MVMNLARLTKTEVQQIIIETIKDNSFYSLDDFINTIIVRTEFSEEVEEFMLIYSPRNISERKIITPEEFDAETDLDEPRISCFSVGMRLQNQEPYSEGELEKYDELVKPLREVGLKIAVPRAGLRGDAEFIVPYIAPRYRGQGNGRRLIALVENIGRNLGLAQIREIIPLDQDEKNFLQHLGYYIHSKGSGIYASKKLVWNQN